MEEKKYTEMSEAAKRSRNEYYRQYRKNNPEKIRAIEARYWERKAAQEAEQTGTHDHSSGK